MRQIIIHVYYMYTLPGKRGTDRVQWHYMYTMSCMSFENHSFFDIISCKIIFIKHFFFYENIIGKKLKTRLHFAFIHWSNFITSVNKFIYGKNLFALNNPIFQKENNQRGIFWEEFDLLFSFKENDNTKRKVIIQTNLALNSLFVISVQSNLY